MNKALAGFHKMSSGLERVLRVLLGVVLAGLTGILFLQVILRFVFVSSLTWSEAVPRLLLIWLVFLGLIPTVKGQHLIIDVLRDRPWLRYLSTAVKWAVLVFLLVKGVEVVTKVIDQKMPITGISRAWQYAAVPVGAGIAAIVGIDEFILLIRSGGKEVVEMESVLSAAGMADEEPGAD